MGFGGTVASKNSCAWNVVSASGTSATEKRCSVEKIRGNHSRTFQQPTGNLFDSSRDEFVDGHHIWAMIIE